MMALAQRLQSCSCQSKPRSYHLQDLPQLLWGITHNRMLRRRVPSTKLHLLQIQQHLQRPHKQSRFKRLELRAVLLLAVLRQAHLQRRSVAPSLSPRLFFRLHHLPHYPPVRHHLHSAPQDPISLRPRLQRLLRSHPNPQLRLKQPPDSFHQASVSVTLPLPVSAPPVSDNESR